MGKVEIGHKWHKQLFQLSECQKLHVTEETLSSLGSQERLPEENDIWTEIEKLNFLKLA